MSPAKTAWIRREREEDHREVETLTRDAFWNLYVPGCLEHYVTHVVREHADCVPEIDLVIGVGERIVGSILYTRATLVDEAGREKTILTFGPVCVRPEEQRRGYGGQLIWHSLQMAAQMGFDAVVIFGSPDNYARHGFVSCRKKDVCLEDGSFPAGMLVRELTEGALQGHRWVYRGSTAYEVDEQKAQAFDQLFEPREKAWRPSQETFYILSRARLE